MAARPAGLIAGIACGVGAALMWAVGFVAARHGIAIGLSPFDITFHRYVWAGFAFLPSVLSPRRARPQRRRLGSRRRRWRCSAARASRW